MGYHRIPVACEYCRKRKIRCIPETDNGDGRCQNCLRCEKYCIFSRPKRIQSSMPKTHKRHEPFGAVHPWIRHDWPSMPVDLGEFSGSPKDSVDLIGSVRHSQDRYNMDVGNTSFSCKPMVIAEHGGFDISSGWCLGEIQKASWSSWDRCEELTKYRDNSPTSTIQSIQDIQESFCHQCLSCRIPRPSMDMM